MTTHQVEEPTASVNSELFLSAPVMATDIVPEKPSREHSEDQLAPSLEDVKGVAYGGFKGISRKQGLSNIELAGEGAEDCREGSWSLGETHVVTSDEETSCDTDYDKAVKDMITDFAEREQAQEEVKLAAQAHEEIWRKKMFKELELQDRAYRKRISANLWKLRKNPQWLRLTGEEKVKESKTIVARLVSDWSSRIDKTSSDDKKVAQNHSPPPAKRSRSSPSSSVDKNRRSTSTQPYSGLDVLVSSEVVPVEAGKGESRIGDSKRRKAPQRVTGILRDFTKPFESSYI